MGLIANAGHMTAEKVASPAADAYANSLMATAARRAQMSAGNYQIQGPATSAPMKGPVTSPLPTGPAGGGAMDLAAQKKATAKAKIEQLVGQRSAIIARYGPNAFAQAYAEALSQAQEADNLYTSAAQEFGMPIFQP